MVFATDEDLIAQLFGQECLDEYEVVFKNVRSYCICYMLIFHPCDPFVLMLTIARVQYGCRVCS